MVYKFLGRLGPPRPRAWNQAATRGVAAIDLLTLETWETQTAAFDRAVLATPGVDAFCSSSAWAGAARWAFHPRAEPFILQSNAGYVALLAEEVSNWGKMLLPLESSWCLGCPLVGRRPLELVHDFCRFLLLSGRNHQAIFLPGIVPDTLLWRAVPLVFGSDYRVYRGPEAARCVAGLEGGPDAYLAHRTAKFRNNLRRAEKRARSIAIQWDYAGHSMGKPAIKRAFSRIMAVESNCWKGRLGQGVDTGPMRLFYRKLLELLAPQGRIRILFARHNDKDVGYIFGGLFAKRYRGFQFSFDEAYRSYSLGNLLQWRMIRQLCEEGVTHYDLGSDIPYKRRWAERTLVTGSLILKRA